ADDALGALFAEAAVETARLPLAGAQGDGGLGLRDAAVLEALHRLETADFLGAQAQCLAHFCPCLQERSSRTFQLGRKPDIIAWGLQSLLRHLKSSGPHEILTPSGSLAFGHPRKSARPRKASHFPCTPKRRG